MSIKKIIPYINAQEEIPGNLIDLALSYSHGGADELFIYNYTKDEGSREEFLSLAKELSKKIDIPFFIGCYMERLEDVKKALYTGASALVVKYSILEDKRLLKEASGRFGSEKIIVELDGSDDNFNQGSELKDLLSNSSIGMLLIKAFDLNNVKNDSSFNKASIEDLPFPLILDLPLPVILGDHPIGNDLHPILTLGNFKGIASHFYDNKDIMKAKHALKMKGIHVNTYESKIPFSEFKKNSQGLLPVITQDYETGEVLMLAYMNEEAYNKTVETGVMTYYSRSRDKLWIKGESSGNYQYVKELSLDCDKDTILAKVSKAGPACHTGSNSCFFTELVKKEYNNTDPLSVFQDVYQVIMDRKIHPKEGSYTNYLFDKGIDKILKKCGEEASEIIIAAKNPGSEELRYEIADFLYHMMVLMVECGLDWDDITRELAHRK
ncbi:MAG TPA: bifunctional phosphoribosyl-AMP cyclohydrolase/phosphoribosyl-ATP diphosphatase HisIE [Clostridiales bacterium]|nr:bifunctional phosphoribosyl-AMP cyclohydrolase/phosphoribosyl-ATP diphosphatase HisIE [Clostridiales bacterium]